MATNTQAPIGIIDSGMGGISIWVEIVRAMPRESGVYWADNANCPYGSKGREEIIELVKVGVKELIGRGVKIIVVACNTATTAAIDVLRNEFPQMPFIGLEPAVKPAAKRTKSGVIGVLATRYTVNSEMFRKTTQAHAEGNKVLAVAGDGLVELVEAGQEEEAKTEALLKQYIEPMIAEGVDELVLACTHYPLLNKAIQRIIAGKGIEVINPAPAIARHTNEVMTELGLVNSKENRGEWLFLSTGGVEKGEKLKERAEKHIFNVYGEVI